MDNQQSKKQDRIDMLKEVATITGKILFYTVGIGIVIIIGLIDLAMKSVK